MWLTSTKVGNKTNNEATLLNLITLVETILLTSRLVHRIVEEIMSSAIHPVGSKVESWSKTSKTI